MAAAAGPVTPQRPSIPGGYIQTPAPAPPATIFAANAASLRNAQPPQPEASNVANAPAQSMSPEERAARNVNETLVQESRFPELESYITQGYSGDYEIDPSPAWQPFQKLQQYALPPKLLEQVGHSGVGMLMGIFPSIGQAWVALDNCLYLWDYTLPNPELIGWEEQNHPIGAVKLVKPKPGVFVPEITHLIVVVTNVEMQLIGVATPTLPNGPNTVALYDTKMLIGVRGISVNCIAASERTGRIFFTGTQTDNLYEFQYQQEEGWFTKRTKCHNHTNDSSTYLPESITSIGQYFGPKPVRKFISQLVIDDSRNLLYSLTNTSEIRVLSIRENVTQVLTRPFEVLIRNVGHFCPQSDLLTSANARIQSLSVIPANEASKVTLMATTTTGCRLYLSVTRGYGMPADGQYPPQTMHILHVRFPPRDPDAEKQQSPAQATQRGVMPYGGSDRNIDTASRLLDSTKDGHRFPPGYFLDFQANVNRPDTDKVFCSAPDSARLNNPNINFQLNQRFSEYGMFIDLPGTLQQVVRTTPDVVGATTVPLGFGNEAAIQFDKASMQFAIVTDSAIQIIRRRRLVDIFASLMRFKSDEGLGKSIDRFADNYGKGEMAATALAVACGQGIDVTSDSRLTTITEPEVIEGARKAFIEKGGDPIYNPNAVTSSSSSQLDGVEPSSRHKGMSLYVSRLVRSIWRATVISETTKPGEAPKLFSTINIDDLRRIQRDLTALSEFLNQNRTFIAGLAGAQAASRTTSRDNEIALQGEHRAMHSLEKLILSIIEGISFVLVLFDNRVDEIIAALGDESKRRAKLLTFEDLFVSASGRDLAKELVKAIVNRNIASGSNVDTVAESLRRKCGSFCSADDVVIFKAQEQVKRASEAGGQTETGRVLLNESQRLFQKVAASLTQEHLNAVVEQYVQMAFYAGAIQLCLVVAEQRDRARGALGWLKDGFPEGDARREAFEKRKSCYELIFWTIQSLDEQTRNSPDAVDGQYTLAARRRNEAYDVVNGSEDTVFQTCLYDWYVSIGQPDRLLDIDTHYVVDYLKRRSQEDRQHADLLWRYHAHHNDYLQAAAVQLDLAKGYFDLSLEDRIECLSRARTNASTRQTALMDLRQSKQQLLREISDLLDVANIQDDILQRMKSEPRLSGQRREDVLNHLNGPILPIDALFNTYADQASYYDICLLIYQVADHRNPADIKASWQSLIDQTDNEAQALYGRNALPWESVGEKVRELGRRLNVSDAMFPIQTLLPMLERYFMEPRESRPPATWVPDLFLDLDIPHETLLPVMEQMYYGNENPFTGGKRKVLAGQMVYLLQSWFKESERKGERVPFGSEENASLVVDSASSLLRGGELDAASRREAENLVANVQRAIR